MTKLGKCLIGLLLTLGFVFATTPAYADDSYVVSPDYGKISGVITFTGVRSFNASINIWQKAACGGHPTAAMFKLTFEDGSASRFTTDFENPLPCGDGPVMEGTQHFGATSHDIHAVTARICQVIGGNFQNCHLDTTTFVNPPFA